MLNSQPQFIDYAIIPHPSEPRVLLLPSASGWELPHVRPARHYWQSVAPLNQGVRALLGLEVTTLRCVWTDYQRRVYAMENHSADWRPPAGAGWFEADQIADLTLAEPDHRALLGGWFVWVAAAPAGRVPWYRPGWFAAASDWIRGQLSRLGLDALGPIEQLRSWERSAILRVNIAEGQVYFKAVPPMFAHEPALTQALAARDPAHFPAVLAVDTEQRWMLMPDHSSPTLDQIPDLARWQVALGNFAQVQIALADNLSSLIALGCPYRPLDRLAAGIDALLADTAALTPETSALSADEIAALRALAPGLKAMCAELASYRIPLSLEHGDFWAGQIVLHGDDDVFIDWSDSSIAHPFFSMNFFCDTAEAEEFLPGVPDLRIRLRDAYLEPWADYESSARLAAAYELAQPLSALHNAITYHQLILPQMEAKWEMWNMIPFYLRKLIALGR